MHCSRKGGVRETNSHRHPAIGTLRLDRELSALGKVLQQTFLAGYFILGGGSEQVGEHTCGRVLVATESTRGHGVGSSTALFLRAMAGALFLSRQPEDPGEYQCFCKGKGTLANCKGPLGFLRPLDMR